MKLYPPTLFLTVFSLALFNHSIGQVSVLTQHNNLSRTGWNDQETILNATNVNPVTFGKVFEYPVDGHVYAQPLYVPGVSVAGKGVHNVVIIATMHNTVYAFDADDASLATQPLWKTNLGASVPLPDPRIGYVCGTYKDIAIEIGILSTPVIDPATNSVYVAFKSAAGSVLSDNLIVLDLRSGNILQNRKVITAEVDGTGDGAENGKIKFRSDTENQRSSLLLYNGIVYLAFAGYCDTPPYHGWLLGYNAANIQEQSIVFNTTPNGKDGGIWMAGQAPSVDAEGYIYLVTGNGTFDAATGSYGNSFLKLRPANGTMEVVDYFAPSNLDYLNEKDLDLGSDGPLLLPGTNLVTASGKEGVLYLLDRNNLGKFNLSGDTIKQRVNAFSGHLHGSSVFYKGATGQGATYWWSEDDYLKAFRLNNGLFQRVPVMGPHAPNGMPGGMLSVSSNGSTAGSAVLWANIPISEDANQATVDGILRAFDPNDLSKELWNSQQIATRDGIGKFAKFCSPTIVNGKVYMATFSNKVMVYGTNPVAPQYREPENPLDTKPGLEYSYYEGSWKQLPDFNSLTPISKAIVAEITLSPAIKPDEFGMTFTGYIDIPATNIYTFHLTSDDGSKLYIGDIELINHNGLHSAFEMTGGIGLKAGKHAFKVVFFEKALDAILTLEISSPSIPKQPVTAAMVSYSPLVASKLLLTPNPVWQTLTLRSGPDVPSGSQYAIYNMSSQLVASGKTTGSTTVIPVHMLAAGNYTFFVMEKSRKRSFRFIKMH